LILVILLAPEPGFRLDPSTYASAILSPQNTVCVTEDGYFAKESYIIHLFFLYLTLVVIRPTSQHLRHIHQL
jgi:hypothetical protein